MASSVSYLLNEDIQCRNVSDTSFETLYLMLSNWRTRVQRIFFLTHRYIQICPALGMYQWASSIWKTDLIQPIWRSKSLSNSTTSNKLSWQVLYSQHTQAIHFTPCSVDVETCESAHAWREYKLKRSNLLSEYYLVIVLMKEAYPRQGNRLPSPSNLYFCRTSHNVQKRN